MFEWHRRIKAVQMFNKSDMQPQEVTLTTNFTYGWVSFGFFPPPVVRWYFWNSARPEMVL